MFESKSKIAKLVCGLSSRIPSEAKRAASQLDTLLYPNYGPGPRLVTVDENRRIMESHYATLRCDEVINPLKEAIKSGSEFARTYASAVLGHIGDKRTLSPLIDAMSDPSPSVREAAAQSLGVLRAPYSVTVLVRALQDSEPKVCRAAASALGNIRSADAVPDLMEYYDRGDRDSKVAALLALGYIGDPRFLPLARTALSDKLHKVRDAAKSALAHFDFERRSQLAGGAPEAS